MNYSINHGKILWLELCFKRPCKFLYDVALFFENQDNNQTASKTMETVCVNIVSIWPLR